MSEPETSLDDLVAQSVADILSIASAKIQRAIVDAEVSDRDKANSCKNCYYWLYNNVKLDGFGACRKTYSSDGKTLYANPSAYVSYSGSLITHEDFYCSEHHIRKKPKKTTKKKDEVHG